MSSRSRRPAKKASAAVKASAGSKKDSGKGKRPHKASESVAEGNTAPSPSAEDQHDDDFDMDPEDVAFDGPGFDPSDSRLYCVCLGTDDGSPMLQCEGCNNWFHFRCIDLTPAAAMNIDSYFCEICTEVGAGVTQLKPPKRAQQATFDQEPPHHWDNDDEGSDDQHNQQNNNWDADYTMEEQEGENSLDEEGSANQKVIPSKSVSAAEFFKHQSGGTAQRKRRKQKGEGMSSDEDDTDDEDFEYGQTAGSRKRAAPKSQSKSKPALHKSASGNSTVKATGSSSGKKESSSSKAQATAAAATRKQCTGTLVKVLEPVFAPSAGNAAAAHTRAEEFAHEVEAEVFEHFAEPDGQPKQKYLAKIRQLLFNLKNSELLRNRVALGRIPPSKLANLSMDDLLTPEQRAMADSVRAKSLKDSVKQDVDANQPRIRMTHKGQEVVGEDQSSARTFGADAPRSPDKPSFDGDLPSARSASREDSQGQSPPAPTRDQALSPNTVGPHARSPTGEEAPVRNSHSPSPPSDRDGSPATSAQTSPRVEEKPKPKVQFDFDSVWGSLQSPPMGSSSQLDTIGASGPESPIDVTQARTEAGDDDYDPFDFGKADDVPTSTTPPMSPSPTAPPSLPPAFREPAPDPCVAIQGFSQVWSGDISMPEEGGFPARAVQVGGRPLGDAPLVWQSLVPSRMAIEGRLPTKNATDYLVQCSFAPTREIVVLALLPNAANGVTLEQAQEKQQYFIDMFVRRDRNGVVPPAPHRRQLVKDCYIVPLKASEENLPEYVELLDEHALGDKGERKSDLLLAVFVLQKGLIPSAGVYNPQSAALPLHTAPTPLPSLTQGHTPVPGFGSPLPSTSGPPLPTSSLAGISEPLPAAAPPPAVFDPAALSSLIDPNLLASLVANASAAAQQSAPQTYAPVPQSSSYNHPAPGSMPPPFAQRQLPNEPPFDSDMHRNRPHQRPYPSYDDRDRSRPRSPPLRSGRDGPPRGRGRGRGGFGNDYQFRGRRGGPRGR